MNPKHRLLLENLIGNEGVCFKIIKNNNSVNLATKILYLQRAINQDCNTFFLKLDKVYQPGLQGKDNLDFVLALKTIHTLRFNHPIQNEHGSEIQALNQFFGPLSANDISEMELAIYRIINQNIATLSKHYDEEISLGIQERKTKEYKIIEQTSWRVKLKLPKPQLIPHHLEFAIQSLDDVLTSEQYLLLPPATQALIAMCQNQTRQLMQEHGATFSLIQALPASELDQLFIHLFSIEQLKKQLNITLTELLAIEQTVRLDLFEHWFNVVQLIQKGNIQLADLVALEPSVRAELFEHTSDYLRLVDIGVPFDILLGLNQPLRAELRNHPYEFKRLLHNSPISSKPLENNQQPRIGLFHHSGSTENRAEQKIVTLEQLSQLSASDFQAMLVNPDYKDHWEFSRNHTKLY